MDRTLLSQATAKPVPKEQQVLADTGKNVPAEPKEKATRQDIEKAIETVNRQFEVSNRSVRIVARPDASDTIIEVVDVETDEVIRQIPEERLLKLSDWWSENGLQANAAPPGFTFDETA
ncbi:MAG: flagellar protein FlaG [Xanthomonadales bacterium]|nr:flagellar protein FlaG [Xanthomonadales bacterium]